MAVVPIHLAVLIPVCAEERDGGIAVTSRIGPQLERMAELVQETTVLAYEPPPRPGLEDLMDFVMRPEGGRMQFVSLGAKGTYRDRVARRRRVYAIVDARSGDWDVLSLPLVNRRVGLVYGRSKCRRLISQIGDHGPTAARLTPVPWRRKWITYLNTLVFERTYRKIARDALFFVNGEALLPHYQPYGQHVDVVRTSARRAHETFFAVDRLTTDTPKLMTVSRLSPIKGIDDAISAFALLKGRSMPGAELHIVGSGPEESALRAHAERLGVADSITWHGWLTPGPELYGLVKEMDVMLTLSHHESLPKTVWESAAHSVLVVATPVGAMPQVFKHDHDIVFVPEFDPEAAASAVERLAAEPDLRQRLLANGRDAAALTTVESVCDEVIDRILRRWPELAAGRA